MTQQFNYSDTYVRDERGNVATIARWGSVDAATVAPIRFHEDDDRAMQDIIRCAEMEDILCP